MKKENIPNYLTYARIIMIPIFVVLFYEQNFWSIWAALGVYTLAAITDFFDGYLARLYQANSKIGKFLDPIADKLLVVTVLFLLPAFDRLSGLWLIPALVIIIRELFVSGLREFLGPMNIKLPVSKLAKWKTTIQMFAIGFLIIGPFNPWDWLPNYEIGQIGITLAAVLTVWTGWRYAAEGFKHF